MTKHWAVTIGINQYEFFQPLSFAQRDAQALRNFLVGEAGFAPDHCLLMTDTSLPMWGRPTYPDRETIQNWIHQVCRERLQPGDLLWCFFSGYGVHYQGQDYLMPIEGDPRNITSTGISIQSLFNNLKAAPTEAVVVMLDMNRSQGSISSEDAGTETIELAQNFELPTVLSCQPGQFSRETSALGHGFFTAALLEALRYQRFNTLANIDRYLSDRVPELSEHHWRPIQEPLTVVNPPERLHQVILPQGAMSPRNAETPVKWESGAAKPSSSDQTVLDAPKTINAERSPSVQVLVTPPARNATAPSATAAPVITHVTKASENGASIHASANREPHHHVNGTVVKPIPVTSKAPEPVAASESSAIDPVFWQRLLLGGSGLLLALLLGVFLLNRDSFVAPLQPEPTPTTAVRSPNPVDPSSDNRSEGAVIGAATTPNGTATATNEQPSEMAPVVAAMGDRSEGTPGSNSPQTDLFVRQTNTTSSTTSNSIPSTASPDPQANRANQAVLDQARVLIRPNQASAFSQAIAQARKIPPGDPLHGQAQQDIERWSRVILDLAQGRAKQGNLRSAIAAAQLVPKDRAIYPQAQQAIVRWRQQAELQQDNQVLLQAAQGLIQPGQASSYNRAISAARRIQPGQPYYNESRRLINQWGQTIFEIAQYRAARGRIKDAIQTALLVPEGVPIYGTAQKAIGLWRSQS